MNKKNIISLAIIFVILIGLYLLSLELRNRSNTQQVHNQSPDNLEVTESESLPNFTYQYRPNYQPGQQYTYSDKTFDGKIVKINRQTKEETAAVASVKKAYPPVGASINLGFTVLSEVPKTNNIYFAMVPNETDGYPYDIIRYNGPKNTFTKLKISNQFDDPAVRAISKFGPFIITTDNPTQTSDDRSLFLLDLENDIAKFITKLPNNETFNFCYQQGCLGGVAGEITWLDANTIEASIYSYNDTETDEWGNPQNKFIQKRKFKVR